jgi:hypothetical protein
MKTIALAAAGVLLISSQIPDLKANSVIQKREAAMKKAAVLAIARQGVFYVGGSYLQTR